MANIGKAYKKLLSMSQWTKKVATPLTHNPPKKRNWLVRFENTSIVVPSEDKNGAIREAQRRIIEIPHPDYARVGLDSPTSVEALKC
jgi:hypothetical protein